MQDMRLALHRFNRITIEAQTLFKHKNIHAGKGILVVTSISNNYMYSVTLDREPTFCLALIITCLQTDVTQGKLKNKFIGPNIIFFVLFLAILGRKLTERTFSLKELNVSGFKVSRLVNDKILNPYKYDTYCCTLSR